MSGACTLSGEPYPFRDIWDPLARVFDAWGFDRCLWGTDWTRAYAVVTFISKDVVATEIGNQTGTLDGIWPKPKLMTRGMPIPRALRQVHRAPEGEAPELRILPRLEKIRDVWNQFQTSRARDDVYEYLEAVFAIVTHYKVRRKTKKLWRHAFKFAGLPLDRNADPFSAVIRCTSDDNADSKAISKWARALRYAARSKEPAVRLRKFMKEAGGINGCATLYARRCKRDSRRSPRDRN